MSQELPRSHQAPSKPPPHAQACRPTSAHTSSPRVPQPLPRAHGSPNAGRAGGTRGHGGGGRGEGICGSFSVGEPGGGCNAVDPSGRLALAGVAASLLRERKAKPGMSSTLMRSQGDVQKKGSSSSRGDDERNSSTTTSSRQEMSAATKGPAHKLTKRTKCHLAWREGWDKLTDERTRSWIIQTNETMERTNERVKPCSKWAA